MISPIVQLTDIHAAYNRGRHRVIALDGVDLTIGHGDIFGLLGPNGIGLPPDAENRPGHYGLRGIRERVEGLGGTLAVGRAAGGKTSLAADIPYLDPLPRPG